jgi:hypothetical protein
MKADHFLNFVALLSITVVTVLSPALVNSQSNSGVNQSNCIREPQSYLNPEKLVILAYQGYLKEQGIPGYIAFNMGFASGKITGEKVVKAAIAGCLLSDQSDNENYIKDVQQQLQLLFQEDLGH